MIPFHRTLTLFLFFRPRVDLCFDEGNTLGEDVNNMNGTRKENNDVTS